MLTHSGVSFSKIPFLESEMAAKFDAFLPHARLAAMRARFVFGFEPHVSHAATFTSELDCTMTYRHVGHVSLRLFFVLK